MERGARSQPVLLVNAGCLRRPRWRLSTGTPIPFAGAVRPADFPHIRYSVHPAGLDWRLLELSPDSALNADRGA